MVIFKVNSGYYICQIDASIGISSICYIDYLYDSYVSLQDSNEISKSLL